MKNEQKFKPGKLPLNLLQLLLKKYAGKDRGIIMGAQIGQDAAVLDFPGKNKKGDRVYLVAKTDPITLASEKMGEYLVNINSNDLACTGAKPKWFLATLLLPHRKTSKKLVEKIFSQVSSACKKQGIALCGGHTEITYNLGRAIIVGFMLGEVEKDKLVRTGGAEIGDDILLTKGIAIEATSIIAHEKEKELKKKYSLKFIRRAKNYLKNPGISVLKEALLANRCAKIHSMHDPTEGGLATGLYEIAKAANKGMLIEEEKILILPEAKILCKEYGLNPLGAIASGALIITLSARDTERVSYALKKQGINCSVIGKIKDKRCGLKIKGRDGKIKNLKIFPRDEITKIY